LRPQIIKFRRGELEQEIRREAVRVALYLLVEPLGGNAVNPGQVHIQDDSLAAHDMDERVHRFQHDSLGRFLHG